MDPFVANIISANSLLVILYSYIWSIISANIWNIISANIISATEQFTCNPLFMEHCPAAHKGNLTAYGKLDCL